MVMALEALALLVGSIGMVSGQASQSAYIPTTSKAAFLGPSPSPTRVERSSP